MAAKKLKKELVEEVEKEEEVEEVLDTSDVLPLENDDVAYEEDLEADGESGEEPPSGEWADE